MVSRNGRFALGALAPALVLLLPPAAPAQCRHMSQPQQGGGGAMPMPQSSQLGMTRFSMPRMSMMQTQQMQLIAMQQVQMLALQQMQLVAVQQQIWTMQKMELLAQRRQEMSLLQQQPPPALPAPSPALTPLGPAQQKQYGELLREMTTLQQRLEALEQAAGRGELPARQASDAQHEVNKVRQRVAALPKVPDAIRERMAALRDLSDDLLRQVSANPADLLAVVRGSR